MHSFPSPQRSKLSAKQKETAARLTAMKERCASEAEEHSRLETILLELRKRENAAKRDLAALKAKDAKLASFITAKAEKAKRHEDLRSERKRLYAIKMALPTKIAGVKRNIEHSQRANAEIERAMEEVQQIKAANDKREAEVILPARMEHEDILVEKKAALAILSRTNIPIANRSFGQEKSKISELRSRREIIRKDFELKRARVQELSLEVESEKNHSIAETQAIGDIARRTALILEEAQSRMDRLKARQAKRNEAFRKLGVLQFGAALIHESKRVERNIAVKQQ